MNDRSSALWYRFFAGGAGILMLVLARANRLTFPYPWDDEARFYLPARWWAQHTSFRPEILHAPNGIFWVPDGFTVVIGLALKLFGSTMDVARTTCECSVAIGLMAFAIGFRKLTGASQAGIVATLLLLTPPVVFAANMVRMESLLFLLTAVALLLHLHGHVVGAAGLLFGSLVFHPALALAAIGYALLAWLTRGRERERLTNLLDWAILIVVFIAIFLEAVHTLSHLDLYRTQMSYQVARKLGTPFWMRVMKPQGAILVLSSAILGVLVMLWRSRQTKVRLFDILPLAALPIGLLSYAVLGGEMAYDVYSLSLAPALVFSLVAAYVYQKDDLPFDSCHTVSNLEAN